MQKICSSCKKTKLYSEFSKHKNRPGGYALHCKGCHSIYRKEHYKKNFSLISKQVLDRKQDISSYVNEIKSNSGGCKICGEKRIACLDFHHKEGKTKKFSLSNARRYGWKKELIDEEIAKCDILCSNCHRCLHAEKLANKIRISNV